jgi:hypothetical protein
MPLEIHNYIWSGERLVQIESQPSHIDGVLDVVQNMRRSSNFTLEWEDIYSAYYECEEDGTITFFEGEGVEVANPGVWTYVVFVWLNDSKIDDLLSVVVTGGKKNDRAFNQVIRYRGIDG